MIEFKNFYLIIAKNGLLHWLITLPAQIANWQRGLLRNTKLKRWSNSVKFLPEIIPYKLDLLHGVTAESRLPLSKGLIIRLEKLLRNLMPWRKGPFSLYGLNIDAEWHSDWKWNRVLPHLSDLTGRLTLDVGSSSGYYLWRMIGAGAKLAVGIDPTELYLYLFESIRKLLGNDQRAHLLPLSIEQLPVLSAFDTVFSMGVFYHRISPLEHLKLLKNQLVSGGELVLETLVIRGDENTVLVPTERYAQMHNVYFIPSTLALKNWLEKCGFVDVRIVDVNITSVKEQRRTDWMVTESLEQFLGVDKRKTVEGYSAPMRAVFIAKKPLHSAPASIAKEELKRKGGMKSNLNTPGMNLNLVGKIGIGLYPTLHTTR